MTNDKLKKALDSASEAATAVALIADTGSAGGIIAGGKLLWAAVTASSSRRRRKEAEAYLDRVAAALGDESTTQLVAALDQDGLNSAWDIIEEGYRAMMAAIHEDSKRAISALVADYIEHQLQPDREYQLAGGLLAALDGDLLRSLHVVTGELLNVFEQKIDMFHLPVEETEILAESYTLAVGPGTTSPKELWAIRVASTNSQNHRLHSKGSSSPGNLAVILRALDRFEFGELPGAVGSSPSLYSDDLHDEGGKAELHIAKNAERRLRRLHAYLRYALT